MPEFLGLYSKREFSRRLGHDCQAKFNSVQEHGTYVSRQFLCKKQRPYSGSEVSDDQGFKGTRNLMHLQWRMLIDSYYKISAGFYDP